MRREKEDVRFNRIFIIQSLGADERQTGNEIELLIKHLSFQGKNISVELTNIEESSGLFRTIEKIDNLIPSGILPFIHFEIHGSKQGLELSNDELVEWDKLKEPLRNLNIKTKNNLFISLATCYGGHLLKIYKPWETCPFFGYIGPTEPIKHLDLEASYSAFFETLLTENDFSKAIEKLQNTVNGNSSKYAFLNCHGYFNRLMDTYKEENQNPRIRNQRTKDLITKFKQRYSDKGLSNKEIKREADRLILTNAEDDLFEEWRKTFFHENSTTANNVFK